MAWWIGIEAEAVDMVAAADGVVAGVVDGEEELIVDILKEPWLRYHVSLDECRALL
jgi:hypothetical protein